MNKKEKLLDMNILLSLKEMTYFPWMELDMKSYIGDLYVYTHPFNVKPMVFVSYRGNLYNYKNHPLTRIIDSLENLKLIEYSNE